MKHNIQQGIRWLHLKLARKPLPDRLALYFHELEPDQYAAFRDGMCHLASLGYRSVSAAEFVATQDTQTDQRQVRKLFISFDDNYRSWHRALPLLAVLNLKVMFYTNTLPFRDTADAPTLNEYFNRIAFHKERLSLTVGELREISEAGHEIGCHTHSHFSLAQLPRNKWDEEILACKHQLEDITGKPVRHFSYPYGMRRFIPQAVVEYCREHDFDTIAHGIPCLQHTPDTQPFMINRSGWRLDASIAHNIANIEIDGSLFERLTGRSPIG